ncbi:MAG: thiol-disulfide oxidoreductase DCC family protein [Vicinamibacterales bacterium]
MPSDHRKRGPAILFDGGCALCHGAMRWVIARDPAGVFRFAPLDSAAARRLMAPAAGPLPDSIVLVDADGVHVESEAVLRIVRRLPGPWRFAAVGVVVPRPVRDAAYRWVARRRRRWFGHRDACLAPTPDVAARLLDDSHSCGPAAPETSEIISTVPP